jgi:hypothetical protein
MKNVFRILMAAFLVSMSATAFAQCIHPDAPGPPRYWDGARRCYVVQGTPSLNTSYNYGVSPQMYGQPYYGQQYGQQYGMPYGGAPMGGGLSNCAVVGGLAGGTLGSLAKHHRGQAVILGALLGGVVGQMVCTNSQGQRVIVQQPQPMAQQYVQQQAFVAGPPIPAEQQVGGFPTMNQPVQRIHVPSDCDIDGHPELQDLKGLTGKQCETVAKLAATRGTAQSDTVAQAPPAPVVQTTKTYGSVSGAKKNADGYPCFVGDKEGNLLADFMDAERNPYKEVALTGPQCKQLTARFASENGSRISKN